MTIQSRAEPDQEAVRLRKTMLEPPHTLIVDWKPCILLLLLN